MKMRVIALFAAACAAVPSAVRAQKAPDLAAFDKYVAQAARDWRVPGLAIAIVHDDSLVFAKGYGVLEVGKTAPATEHKRFAIGSTTKAMTPGGAEGDPRGAPRPSRPRRRQPTWSSAKRRSPHGRPSRWPGAACCPTA